MKFTKFYTHVNRQATKEEKSKMFRYFTIAKKYFGLGLNNKKLLFLLGLTAFLRNASILTLPFIASVIVEHATMGDFTMAMIWAAIFLISGLLYVLFRHLNFVAYKNNAIFVHTALQKKILDKVSHLDENFTKDISVSFIINSGFADIARVHTIADFLFDTVLRFMTMFVVSGILIFVDTTIGIATLTLSIFSLWVFGYNVKKRDLYLAARRRAQDKITGLFKQIINAEKEIKAFNIKDDLSEYLESYKKNWRFEFFSQRKYQDRLFTVIPAILSAGKILIYFVTIGLVLRGDYHLSILILVVGYYEELQLQFKALYKGLELVAAHSIRIDRVHKILRYRTEHMMKFGDDKTDDIKGKIEFKNVTFAYEEQSMLKNVSFEIKPNSFTAIVGKSGNGKSTIFRLLLRLYKANKGKILLDDIDIYDFAKDVYANNVSVVTQKPFIFNMSIRENLNLVDSNRENQIKACKKVGIHDYIMNLKDGYNTKLIDDGENISSGERQLLAFARALLSNAEVLLFDEVTSNLDIDTSKRIFKVMQSLKKSRTILIITHNPELMKISDDIMVIDRGKLVGRGTHNSLIQKNKYYKLLQK